MTNRPFDEALMRRALELARRGLGCVEPNPAVGAVVADDSGAVLGEGWHQQFGGPHAEVHALAAAGERAKGATLYVTLEPCCHFGKTPPCTKAVIAAGIRRVIIGTPDPVNHGTGRGTDELTAAGIDVEVSVLQDEAKLLIAPFERLANTGLPWVHAKWAMTLDGKIATTTGSSQWISNAASRDIVHQIRGRMDAIITGIGTVLADDPKLTARPSRLRVASRIVLDSQCRIGVDSKLVQSAAQTPLIVVTSSSAPAARTQPLRNAGVEVLQIESKESGLDLRALLQELGRRRMTNVLIEAGGRVLGSFFDERLVNEVHAFVAPAIAGGARAASPVGGTGVELMSRAMRLKQVQIELVETDVYVHGFVD